MQHTTKTTRGTAARFAGFLSAVLAGGLLFTGTLPQAEARGAGSPSARYESDAQFINHTLKLFDEAAARVEMPTEEAGAIRASVRRALTPEATWQDRSMLIGVLCMVGDADGLRYVKNRPEFQKDPTGDKNDRNYIEVLYTSGAYLAACTGHVECLAVIRDVPGMSLQADNLMWDIMLVAVAGGHTDICQFMVLNCKQDMVDGTVAVALSLGEQEFLAVNRFRLFNGLPELSKDEWMQGVADTVAYILNHNNGGVDWDNKRRADLVAALSRCPNPYLRKVLEPYTTKH